MKRILAILVAGLMIGALGAHAKLPAAPAKSDEEKKAEADKAAAAKAKDADDLGKAQDRAVANFKKNNKSTSSMAPTKASKK